MRKKGNRNEESKKEMKEIEKGKKEVESKHRKYEGIV
jgi:hypothetical protein